MKTTKFFRTALSAIACLGVMQSQAQELLTTYHMRHTPMRLELNPALTPDKGFVTIPVIGNVGAQVSSNVFGTSQVMDIIDNEFEGDYFIGDKFYKTLLDANYLKADVNTSIVHVGVAGKTGYWNASLGLRTNVEAKFSKDVFGFMRDMRNVGDTKIDWNSNVDYHVGHVGLNAKVFAEVGVGYAREILDGKLSFGGKAKALLGVANMDLAVNNVNYQFDMRGVPQNVDWGEITYEELQKISGYMNTSVNAHIDGYFKGVTLDMGEHGSDLEDMDFDLGGSKGLAGMGVAFDLGAAYKVLPELTVSASITDLGFINWHSDAAFGAKIQGEKQYNASYDSETIAEILGGGQIFSTDVLSEIDNETVRPGDKPDERRSLASNLYLGADYQWLEGRLSAGIVGKGHFGHSSYGEFSIGGCYSPSKMVDLALSYNVIQSRGQSFGLGITAGPLFIGTDYMFLGSESHMVNARFALFIPLSGK